MHFLLHFGGRLRGARGALLSTVCAKNVTNMCIICEGYFPSSTLLKEHANDCRLKFAEVCPPGLKCAYCEKEYKKRWMLIRHYKEKHKEEPSYRCTECQEISQPKQLFGSTNGQSTATARIKYKKSLNCLQTDFFCELQSFLSYVLYVRDRE